MTIDIEAIKARAEKATPGPWENATVMPARDTGDIRHPESPWQVVNGPPQVIEDGMASRRAFTRPADAAFIAHARTDIPALIAALDERDATIRGLREKMSRLLDVAEDEMAWALKGSSPCDLSGDAICQQCQEFGCARLIMQEARAALAKGA